MSHFEKYLKKIGKINKNIKFDFENDNICWRYLAPAYLNVYKHDRNQDYYSYGCGNHGEVLVNKKVIGYFEINQSLNLSKEKKDNNWFYYKYILNPSIEKNQKPLPRLWGQCHYIWETVYKED